MSRKLRCIMLVDDNPDDNFFHERVIRNNHYTECIIPMLSATDALDYLKAQPKEEENTIDLIFLDINMPGMNGWEFLEEYNKLDKDLQGGMLIVMLTTSNNPDDKEKAKKWSNISDYRTKPLTKEMIEEIIEKFFKPE